MLPDSTLIAISTGHQDYPATAPFSPAEAYPEYPLDESELADAPNAAYEAVRSSLVLLGLDPSNEGRPSWNPLGQLIQPGDTVVLKPNFIRDFHDTRGDDVESVITNGSIIRAVLDYVAIALNGEGRVVIADAPQCEASFERLASFTGLDEIRALYARRSSLRVDVIDLRPERTEKVDGVIVGHRPLPGDPAGYTVVNLGRDSEFTLINHMNERLYGSEYDRSEVAAHHHDDVHEYLISRTILGADVFINLPKLKTHKKVGVTLNLKNLVGINGNKNWLPHHREGVPANGGDQYAESGLSERVEQFLLAGFKKHFPKLGRLRKYAGGAAKALGRTTFGDTETTRIRSGNWYGNDTTWRMVLDLNRALRYADANGVMHDTAQRRCFSIVDGIVGGEGNGPMGSDPYPAGMVVAGGDPLAVDLACTRLMGFDYRKIPLLVNAMSAHRYPLKAVEYEQVRCCSNEPRYRRRLTEFEGSCLGLRPHFGWTGHVELAADGEVPGPI